MLWREVLHAWPGLELPAGCDEAPLDEVAVALGMSVPEELRALYRSTDGIHDVPAQYDPVWPVGHLVTGNLRLRDLDLPTTLLAFGDNGCGEPFCLSTAEPGVFCWYPISLEQVALAADLHAFVVGWLSGTITS